MRLFPTVHATGDLAPAQRAHLELHGLAFVAADDDPDLVLVLPGTTPAGDTTRTGVVVLATGSETPEVAGLLASRGITVHASSAPASGLVPADLTADDLLAWTTDVVLPVHATLDVEGPAAPLLRTATGSQALGLTVGAGVRDGHGRLLVLGVDVLEAPEVLLNAAIWAARPAAAVTADDRHDELVSHPAWSRLKRDVTELQGLQVKDGSVPDEEQHPRARELVHAIARSVDELAPALPHDEDYLTAVGKDLTRWSETGFGIPDFLDALVAFHPQRQRVDGLAHLVLFPMYTQNGSTDRRIEAVLLQVRWPDLVAHLEAEQFSNALFVPVTFLDFTPGYDTNSAVLFPETVAVREVPTFTWGAIFADREAARFRRVVRAAADTTRLALPPDAARLLDDQRLAEETFVLWDLVHDRTHMRGDLPFDPFMIKQRMPFFLYSLEELRCDLTAFRAAVRLEGEGVPHARYVQYAILFDRLFRFPVTGTRVRNYDGLGGQLLFAWLHQHHVLHWTDSRLTIDWPQVPDAVIALAEQIEQLYWRSIDRPKTAHWLAAYALVSGTVTPHPASVWARGDLPLDGPPKGFTDAVLDDEFPLSMFYEALSRKIGDVVASTSGITA
ncbi:hypothetical protein J2X26_002078 [Cellulomonas humilata]|uniref:Uncharacterized protein n=1 Tax=Cellulomonas humilata TaxID=144055 RepID=A0ABU0EES6_9CELL|nr:hypothetical protein [Cellulomonas humilata]